jgi:hypothetical protein
MPRWLSQLRLSQKFLILGVLALVMVAIPTGLYIKDVLGNLRHADQEAAGMAPLMAINQAVQQIQLHRGTTAGMLGGDTGMANRRPGVRDAVNQALQQAQDALQQAQAPNRCAAACSSSWHRPGWAWSRKWPPKPSPRRRAWPSTPSW